MNHLNPNNYGLQDIPEPFRGQHRDMSNPIPAPMPNPAAAEPEAQAVSSNSRLGFRIDDLLLILLIFLILSDYK